MKRFFSFFGCGGRGLLRKRPAIYVLVLCKYYMSSTFAQLFGITSTGWVYYFRNMPCLWRGMTYFQTLLSFFLSGIFFPFSFPSFSHSFYLHFPPLLSYPLSRSAKSQMLVPAEQLQGRETQMEMFVENNMCIIKV